MNYNISGYRFLSTYTMVNFIQSILLLPGGWSTVKNITFRRCDPHLSRRSRRPAVCHLEALVFEAPETSKSQGGVWKPSLERRGPKTPRQESGSVSRTDATELFTNAPCKRLDPTRAFKHEVLNNLLAKYIFSLVKKKTSFCRQTTEL